MADCADQLRTVEAALAKTEAALEIAKEEEQRARFLALHDPLTGLANRELFDEKLANAIAVAGRRSWSLAVMFLDLDSFKSVNDIHGHAVGDFVLRETAARLQQKARDEDTLCRNGGDEFLYLLLDPQGRRNIENILARAREKVGGPIDVDGRQITVTISVGIAVYPEDGASGAQLVRNADAAMYEAKMRRSGWRFFSDSDRFG